MPSASCLCPEAEQHISSTCSVVGQIKAHFTALTRALLHSLGQVVPESTIFFLLLSTPQSLTAFLDSHVQLHKKKLEI